MTFKSGQELALFILPHYDDEFYFAPLFDHESEQNSRIMVVYTTYGSVNSVSHEDRRRESDKAFSKLGTKNLEIVDLGHQLGVLDGESHRRLQDLFEGVDSLLDGDVPDRIYAYAWEGGHADHDASHLLAMALAKSHDREEFFYEASGYNGFHVIPPFFRVMYLIPSVISKRKKIKFSCLRALQYMGLSFCYRSQWKTFVGLSVQNFLKLVGCRFIEVQSEVARDYDIPPHVGPLFYESRFNISFQQFKCATKGFVDRYLSES